MSTTNFQDILLNSFPTISLDEMSAVRLMNRIDTKYLTNADTLYNVLSLAKGKYMVQQIDGAVEAEYSTCYFDTESHDMYTEHQRGKNNRTKIRIREYVDSDLMFLEVKRRNNKGRTDKRRIQISEDNGLNSEESLFIMQNTLYNPLSLTAQLRNRFRRITMVNVEKSERLTIDTSIRFHNLATGKECDMGNLVVIELKRDGNSFSPIKSILQECRVQPSGFSKYCIGASLTNPSLKQNRFKIRQRYIERIINK